MQIAIDTTAFSQALQKKKAQMDAARRPAAQAGAQVIYAATLDRVPVGTKGHWFHGTSFKKNGTKYFFDAGTLRNSIYQVHSDQSTAKKDVYHVSWNHRKAPYGFMVEFGTKYAPAHPFLGRAIHETKDIAAKAMRDRFVQEMSK